MGLVRSRSRTRRTALVATVGVAALVVAATALAVGVLRQDGSATPEVVPESLVEIDPATNAVVGVTEVGRAPDRLAVGAGFVWVVNRGDRTVTRVGSGGVDTIGGVPFADHVAVDGDHVWVSSLDRASIARIDADSGEVVESIGLPSQHAEGLAVGGGSLWVTNPATERGVGTETVSRIDLRTLEVEATIPVGTTPIFTTFGDGSVWVSNYDADTVSVIRPGSAKAQTIDACDGPLGIATGFESVWVVCYWSNELLRIDQRTLEAVAHIPLGPGPLDVSVGAGAVWATSRDSREIQRIDPSSNDVVSRVELAGEASPNSIVAVDDAVWVTVARCPHPPCF